MTWRAVSVPSRRSVSPTCLEAWVCGAARSDSDVDVRRVGKTGEIDPALSRQLQGWAGFRNVLVHDHLTLDHRIAYRTIHSDLGDLDAFRRWALGKLDAD